MKSTKSESQTLQPDRIERNAAPMLIAGLNSMCQTREDFKNVPAQWEKFATYQGNITGQKSSVSYGLCVETESGNGIEYISGVEVSGTGNLPDGFVSKKIDSFDYAVFKHKGHVSEIPEICDTIWKEWIPASGAKKPDNADFFFERYEESFNPETGTGGIEIWLPVEL